MKKYIALFLTVVMAVSIVSVAGVVTTQKAEALSYYPTVTRLTSTPSTPKCGQGSVISGTVRYHRGDGVDAGPVTQGYVGLYHYTPGSAPFGWKTLPVINGAFSVTGPVRSAPTTDFYYAKYLGTPMRKPDGTPQDSWQPSTSPTLTVITKLGTKLSLRVSGGTYFFVNRNTVSGYLTDQYGRPVPSKAVYVNRENYGTGHKWTYDGDHSTTNAKGYWKITDSTGYATNYYAVFKGDNQYFSAQTAH